MAAPTEASLVNLNGRWSINQSLSDPYGSILKAQEVNWLTRKVLTMSPVVASIQQRVNEAQLTCITIHSKPSSGLPRTTEQRVLNGESRELTHALFGRIRGRTEWVERADLPAEWLGAGLEVDASANGRIILMTTEHLDINATTYQANGFEVVSSQRHYVRRVEVRKGDDVTRVRLVYDYLGPAEDGK
jgi:hypothetical protein